MASLDPEDALLSVVSEVLLPIRQAEVESYAAGAALLQSFGHDIIRLQRQADWDNLFVE